MIYSDPNVISRFNKLELLYHPKSKFMQWVKTKKEVQEVLNKDYKDQHTAGFRPHSTHASAAPFAGASEPVETKIANCFTVYDDEGHRDKALASFRDWVKFPKEAKFKDPCVRLRYELYYGGWLQYYDEIARSGATDSVIWFDWDNEKEKEVIIKIAIAVKWQLINPVKVPHVATATQDTSSLAGASTRPVFFRAPDASNPPGSSDPPKPGSPPPY
jgi:hypothetical protein